MSNPNHDEELSAQAAAELEDGNRDEGLWAKCFAECDGEENRAKARYIKTRAERLAVDEIEVGESLINPKDAWKGEPAVVAEPETKPEEEDWKAWKEDQDARWKKENEVCAAWQTPEKITWVLALLIWYLLNAFVIRQTFNPHFPDYDRHEWIGTCPSCDVDISREVKSCPECSYFDEYGFGGPQDDWSILEDDDGEGNYYIYYPNKWLDPKSRKEYSLKHPDVVSGIRKEKVFRGLFTFLCGLPVVGFYYFRTRQYNTDPDHLRETLKKGLIWCGVAALILGLTGHWAQGLVDTIESLLCCGAIVLPFFLLDKWHLLFGKKKAERTVD